MCGRGAERTIEKVVDNPLDAILNAVVSYGTGGFAGYKGGGLRKGVTSKAVVGGLKDVTGASATEDATRAARDRFEEAKKDALKQREEAQAKTSSEQIALSRQAASARGVTKKSKKGVSRFSSLGSDGQDFLGL